MMNKAVCTSAAKGNQDVSSLPHERKERPAGLSKHAVTAACTGRSGGMEPGRSHYAPEVAAELVLIGSDSVRSQIFGGSIDPGLLRWLEETLREHQGREKP